jgi:hypothetical protein
VRAVHVSGCNSMNECEDNRSSDSVVSTSDNQNVDQCDKSTDMERQKEKQKKCEKAFTRCSKSLQNICWGSDINKTGVSMAIRSVIETLRKNATFIIPCKILLCVLRLAIALMINSEYVEDSSMTFVYAQYILMYVWGILPLVICLLGLREFAINSEPDSHATIIKWTAWHKSHVFSFKQTGTVCDEKEERLRHGLKTATGHIYRDAFIILAVLMFIDARIIPTMDRPSAWIAFTIETFHMLWLISSIRNLHLGTAKYLEIASDNTLSKISVSNGAGPTESQQASVRTSDV